MSQKIITREPGIQKKQLRAEENMPGYKERDQITMSYQMVEVVVLHHSSQRNLHPMAVMTEMW